MGSGWKPGKFIVRHYRRGDLLDGEAFVLVPERDPAAIAAIRAYADATPDDEIADRLRQWLADLGHTEAGSPVAWDDRVPSWVVSLASEVQAGTMTIDTALLRMAALCRTSVVG